MTEEAKKTVEIVETGGHSPPVVVFKDAALVSLPQAASDCSRTAPPVPEGGIGAGTDLPFAYGSDAEGQPPLILRKAKPEAR